MPFIFNLLILLWGLCIGSFLNCVLYRLEKNESFVKGRSYCPHCKHPLSWLDLVPVASFLFLKGKCRHCGVKISWQYPLVEIGTALIFLIIFNFQFFQLRQGFVGQAIFNQFSILQLPNLVFLWYIASVLILIFIYDLKFYLIPDSVLFPAIVVVFLYRLFENLMYWNLIGNWELGIGNSPSILNFLLAAGIASGFFSMIFLVSRGRWMGFGDVKLAILLGLLLGFPNVLAGLFLSFLFGAAAGITLIFFAKKGLKSQLPFAPFLIIATAVAMVWGQAIVNWYLHFLLF